VEVVASPVGQAKIAQGAPPYCNDCGFTLAEKALVDGRLGGVELSPTAAEALDRMTRESEKK